MEGLKRFAQRLCCINPIPPEFTLVKDLSEEKLRHHERLYELRSKFMRWGNELKEINDWIDEVTYTVTSDGENALLVRTRESFNPREIPSSWPRVYQTYVIIYEYWTMHQTIRVEMSTGLVKTHVVQGLDDYGSSTARPPLHSYHDGHSSSEASSSSSTSEAYESGSNE